GPAGDRRPDRAGHHPLLDRGSLRELQRQQIPPLPVAQEDGRRRPPRPQERQGFLRLRDFLSERRHGRYADQDQRIPVAVLQEPRFAAGRGHLRARLRQLAARHAARRLRREGIRRDGGRRGPRPRQLPHHQFDRSTGGAQTGRRGLRLELTPEQRAAREEFRAFVAAEIAPHAGGWDRAAAIPMELVDRLRERGYLGSNVAAERGGPGRDNVTYGLLTEEIGKGCSSVRSLLTVHDMVAHVIGRWGSSGQRQRYLPALAKGEILGAFCLSEPNAGSDAKSVETVARDD